VPPSWRASASRRRHPACAQAGGGVRSATGIPDVPLVTHEGKRVRFYSDLIRDKVVFVSMMYAQCSDSAR
jgi:protein SCO1/2